MRFVDKPGYDTDQSLWYMLVYAVEFDSIGFYYVKMG